MRELFGELRGLLEQVPSIGAFGNVVRFLEHHAQDEAKRAQIEAEWIPYALGKLQESWPDRTRECPQDLLEGYEANSVVWVPLVTSLNFEGQGLAQKRTARLLEATHMGAVTCLDLRSCRVKWEQLNDIADANPFGVLTYLAFRKSTKSVDYQELSRFFASKMLSRVEHLSFRGWDKIKPDVYTLMTESFPLENLKVLDFCGSKVISSRRLKELLDTGRLGQLEELYVEIDGGYKTHEGVLGELAKNESMSHLRVLSVTGVNAKDIKLFAKATHFESLEVLKLHGVKCAVEDEKRFWHSEHFPALRRCSIALEDNHSERTRVLLNSSFIEKLEMLFLSISLPYESYGDESRLDELLACTQDIIRAPGLSGLKQFKLEFFCGDFDSVGQEVLSEKFRPIFDTLRDVEFEQLQGLALCVYASDSFDGGLLGGLVDAPYMSALEEFQLEGNVFTDVDVDILTTSKNIPAYRHLGLAFDLSKEAFQRLMDAGKLGRAESLRFFDYDDRQSTVIFEELLADRIGELALRRIYGSYDLGQRVKTFNATKSDGSYNLSFGWDSPREDSMHLWLGRTDNF